ncbi:SDR family oxidoreductase [Nocardioidaceae bacterium SCSIO 66511]|nr:SDR family oxidoreductase [Nocardioidaceae bacterium SCSIO 66511]
MSDERPLSGKVALVAGATRGAGRAIAVELARAGAYVYATGRSSRVDGPSEIDRPETIEETGERIAAAGSGIALRVDHLEPGEVEELVSRIRTEHGRLDILVNDIFGGDRYAQFGKKIWEHDLPGGLRMLRMGIDTHAITSHYALSLLIERPGGLVIEMTDGTFEYNTRYRGIAGDFGVGMYYDLVKAAVQRLTLAQSEELKEHDGVAVAVTPGWLRSEMMLQVYGVTEDTWQDAIENEPHFAISESPAYVARGIAALAADPGRARYNGRSLSSGELGRTYDVTDVDGSRPDCWAYVQEVQDPGLPANVAGYR